MIRVLIYGDSNLNLIDGSSVWITSIAAVLSEIVDEVHVLIKTPIVNERLIETLEQNEKIHLHAHRSGSPIRNDAIDPLNSREAGYRIAQLTSQLSPAVVLVRGFDACAEASQHKGVAARLWSYVTDLPFPLSRASARGISRLRRIATNSKRMLSQTDASRSYLESLAPESAGKTILLPPMVPDYFFESAGPDIGSIQGDRSLKLLYAGKFAKDWRTLEMLELPSMLAERGIESSLTFIGDKFQRDRKDPSWHVRMKDALSNAAEDAHSSITWLGGLSRKAVASHIREADIGLGWRSRSMNSSLELSSKLLEYGSCKTSPLINRTSDHEHLFGQDYPLFVDSDDISHVASVIADNITELRQARTAAFNVAQRFSYQATIDRLRTEFSRASVLDRVQVGTRALRLGIATHDQKFMGDLLDIFLTMPDINPQIDRWETLHDHSEARSNEVRDWAEVILCEWAGPNAVWYSQNKKRGSRLIVRLHAFELRGPWIEKIDKESVDQWIFVSEPYRQLAIAQLNLAPERCTVIHNGLNTRDFDRPKAIGAQFHIGLTGYVTYNKRPDRALDLIEYLLSQDKRYVLHIKGRAPWEYEYEWKKTNQRLAYEDLYRRIQNSRSLSESVVFEPFSPDVASWLRRIGVILSPSVSESFHLAPAEGMASGAVPVVWDRPGAQDIFGAPYLVQSVAQAAEAILRLQPSSTFERESQVAKIRAKGWDTTSAHELWKRLLRA